MWSHAGLRGAVIDLKGFCWILLIVQNGKINLQSSVKVGVWRKAHKDSQNTEDKMKKMRKMFPIMMGAGLLAGLLFSKTPEGERLVWKNQIQTCKSNSDCTAPLKGRCCQKMFGGEGNCVNIDENCPVCNP